MHTNIQGCLATSRTTNKEAVRKTVNKQKDDLYNGLDPYYTDIIKITNSLSFVRLAEKTAVFTNPTNPHVRNRLTHTLSVANIATIIANILGLNINLVRAGALGHDLGHTPYGHLGEKIISNLLNIDFKHQNFGCVLVQEIENLNLTKQTLRCIKHHSRGSKELTNSNELRAEEAVVMLSDKIAYIWDDIEDSVERKKIINFQKLPAKLKKNIMWFGKTKTERINKTIHKLCLESSKKGYPSFSSSEAALKFASIKKTMYEQVYNGEELNLFRFAIEQKGKQVLNYTLAHIKDNPVTFFAMLTDVEVDLIAELLNRQQNVDLQKFSSSEMLQCIQEKIDFLTPNLNW